MRIQRKLLTNKLPEEPVNKEEKEEEELLNFEKPDFIFIPKGRHEWRQQGYYLVCKSCDLTHAVYIGQKKIMVGIDKDGQPILKDRKELKSL